MDRFEKKSFAILVVEDNTVIRNMLLSALASLGYRNVFPAFDGKEGWDIIEQEKIDLIISDYYMPRLNGLQLLSKVRSSNQYWSIPFIMLTSEARKSMVIYSTEEEIDAYIVKPVSPDSLGKYVDEVLKNRYAPNDFYKAVNAGKIKLRMGKKEQALESFMQATNINPAKSTPYFYLGEILEGFNKDDEALENYRKCDDASNSLYVRAFDGLARIFIKKQDYASAAQVLKKAVEVSPAQVDRALILVKCCREVGDLEGVRKYLSIASEMAQNNVATIEKVARIYFDLGQYDEAETILRQGYDQSSRELKVFNQFGLMAKEKGEHEKSKKYYQEALKISPHNDIVNYNYAVLFIEMKEYQAAKAHIKRALLNNPDFKEGKELLDKLEHFFSQGE